MLSFLCEGFVLCVGALGWFVSVITRMIGVVWIKYTDHKSQSGLI